jgi:hypothetical protein
LKTLAIEKTGEHKILVIRMLEEAYGKAILKKTEEGLQVALTLS